MPAKLVQGELFTCKVRNTYEVVRTPAVIRRVRPNWSILVGLPVRTKWTVYALNLVGLGIVLGQIQLSGEFNTAALAIWKIS